MQLIRFARHHKERQSTTKSEKYQGFTLIELIVAMVMVGILASLSAPSVLGLIARGRLSSALNQVRGAVQEAQRTASKKSVACSLTFSSTTVTSTDGCLPTGRRTLDQGITLSENVNLDKMFITYLGGVDDTKTTLVVGSSSLNSVVIVLASQNIRDRKCLLVTLGLGLIRSGRYVGASGTTLPDQCIVDQQ